VADEERRIKATLEVDTEGDVQAFDRAADNIREIDQAAEGAAPSVDKLGDELREAGRAADSVDGSITGGGKAGGAGGGGLLAGLGTAQKVLAGAGAAVLVFKESFNQTREVVRFFKDQFGIDIDSIVTNSLRLNSVAEAIVGVSDSIADQTDLLTNQQKIFNNLKLDGFTQNIEKNADLLEQHFRRIRAGADHAAEGKQAVEEFLASLGLSAEAATAKADALATKLEQVFALRPEVDKEDLQKAIGGQIEAVLAALDKAGAKVPAGLQAIIDKLGGLPAATTPANVALANTATSITQLGEATYLVPSSIGSMEEAIARLQGGLDNTASSAGGAAGGVGKVTEATSLLPSSIDTVEEALDRLQGGLDNTATSSDEATESLKGPADKAGEVATQVDKLATAAGSAATSQKEAASAAEQQKTSLEQLKTGPLADLQVFDDLKNAAQAFADVDYSNQVTGLNAVAVAVRQITADAQAAANALRSIDRAGEGGGEAPAPEPAP